MALQANNKNIIWSYYSKSSIKINPNFPNIKRIEENYSFVSDIMHTYTVIVLARKSVKFM